jgi:DNA-binding response OmpR family regulator
MSFGICFITAGLPQPSAAEALLRKCGIEVWTPTSPGADGGHIYEDAICLVLDMPRESGVETLRLLRDYGVKTPAILIVDSGFAPSPSDLEDAWVLNIIPRTADPREVLRWIESMCITQKLLDRVRLESEGASLHLMSA